MEMTIEKAYQGMKEYFSRPGAELAFDKYEKTCKYRTIDGKKCAIGCLIPDDMYNPGMEHTAVELVVEQEMGWTDTRLKSFLFSAQEMHDNCRDTSHFLERLEIVYQKAKYGY